LPRSTRISLIWSTCAGGWPQRQITGHFQKLNFQIVYHLDAGSNGWTKAGKPVEK